MMPPALAALAASALLLGGGEDTLAAYHRSPVELHRELRRLCLDGRPARERIRKLADATGDHSYRSLARCSPALREALGLQRRAWQAWSAGEWRRALALYREAADGARKSGAATEEAFAYYYAAEIRAEREQYARSLELLEAARRAIEGLPCDYLGALLAQSRGYNQWYLESLSASARSFAEALAHWSRIGYREALLTCWNNLAVLYEELLLWREAEQCYRRALALLEDSTDEQIRFSLLCNLAALLARLERRGEAARYLEAARALARLEPERFLIVEATVAESPKVRERLDEHVSNSRRFQVEKLLLQARREGQDFEGSAQRLREALRMSRDFRLQPLARRAALELARLLESRRRYREAGELHRVSFLGQPAASELALPYSRAVSPFLDGWIRCLIRLGRAGEARQVLDALADFRRRRVRALSPGRVPVPDQSSLLDRFASAARFEAPLSTRWRTARGAAPSAPYSIVQMWPDGRRVFVWIHNTAGWHFRELETGSAFLAGLKQALEPIRSGSALLSNPDRHALHKLYRVLFSPLEDLLDSPAVLMIPHKELEAVPFEALVDEEDRFLIRRFDFSYLPALPRPSAPAALDAPLAVLSPGPDLAHTEREQRFFQTWFPEARLSPDIPRVRSSPLWIHVSGHFRLDTAFWPLSHFQLGARRQPLRDLFDGAPSCGLLSLAVCDTAGAGRAISPFWLGLGELLLARGAGALLLSRWPLEDAAAEIHHLFFAGLRRGLSMDRAASQARRRFLEKRVRRNHTSAAGSHPFFWAGVVFVGTPGQRLYEPAPGPEWMSLLSPLFILLLTLAVRRGSAGRSGCRRRAAPAGFPSREAAEPESS